MLYCCPKLSILSWCAAKAKNCFGGGASPRNNEAPIFLG